MNNPVPRVGAGLFGLLVEPDECCTMEPTTDNELSPTSVGLHFPKA